VCWRKLWRKWWIKWWRKWWRKWWIKWRRKWWRKWWRELFKEIMNFKYKSHIVNLQTFVQDPAKKKCQGAFTRYFVNEIIILLTVSLWWKKLKQEGRVLSKILFWYPKRYNLLKINPNSINSIRGGGKTQI